MTAGEGQPGPSDVLIGILFCEVVISKNEDEMKKHHGTTVRSRHLGHRIELKRVGHPR